MPFNFIAHHSCRHCSGHLFYSNGKCYGEEEGGSGGGEEKGLGRVCVCVESKRVDRVCGLGCSSASCGHAMRRGEFRSVQKRRQTWSKHDEHPLLLEL